MILLRLRGSALLRQGLLSEPEASSAPVSMFLADFRSLSSIRRRSPARTAVILTGKYVEKLLGIRKNEEEKKESGITMEFLEEFGF